MANTEPSSSKTIGLENKTVIDMQAKKKKRPREKKLYCYFFVKKLLVNTVYRKQWSNISEAKTENGNHRFCIQPS